jgi:integrase
MYSMFRGKNGMESLLNPVAIRKPQPKNSRTRRLEALPVVSEKTGVTSGKQIANEIEHIIAATHSLVLPAIILLALETAMRRSEIAELDGALSILIGELHICRILRMVMPAMSLYQRKPLRYCPVSRNILSQLLIRFLICVQTRLPELLTEL